MLSPMHGTPLALTVSIFLSLSDGARHGVALALSSAPKLLGSVLMLKRKDDKAG